VTGPYKKRPKFQPLEGIAENGVGLGATILKAKKEWTLINGLAPTGSFMMFFFLSSSTHATRTGIKEWPNSMPGAMSINLWQKKKM